MEIEILNFGASIRSIYLPYAGGRTNVALGYRDINQYKNDPFFVGATVGRFANRIAKGQFEIDGSQFQLPKNNGENHLHGGPVGFAKQYWELIKHTESSVVLSLLSKDGDQGYPGNLSVQAEFRLEPGMRLSVEYRATSDKATPVNVSSHTYFNLNGVDQISTAGNHEVKLNAGFFTPVNQNMIPTGEIRSVLGSEFDFREMAVLSAQFNTENAQIGLANGFDHNFIIDGKEDEFRSFGKIRSPESGIAMSVYSNQPGVQFYTGNFLDKPFVKHQGFCLETQSFPDAPNNKSFPNTILTVGETYLARTVFEFDGL